MPLLKSKVAWTLAVSVVLCAGLVATAIYESMARREHFRVQVDDTSNDVAEVVDKLTSDATVFDLADDRAVTSIQKLRDAAYTERQREGATQLGLELSMLRACRAAKGLPGDKFQACLESTQKINTQAFEYLGIH
jgi:hypothetical protein